jgi:2-polyprenyl-3-methyl-5-hydroxy-6-metoxy-1,4-benzoquinol methylase
MSVKPISQTLDDERPRPDSPDAATFHHHLARYQFALERLGGGERILDAGCGTGYGTALLAERGGFVLGFDYSPLAIEYARAHFSGPKLSYAVMNAQQLAVAAATFEVVISFEVFEHMEDSDAFLAECRRVLRPGGRLILSTPNQETHDLHMNSIGMKNEFHINLMNGKKLKMALRRYFSEVEIYGQRRKGNRLYDLLRALDVFNLRLRLFANRRRESLQQRMGVPVAPQAQAGAWVFSKSQLRQCNQFVAVCRKN